MILANLDQTRPIPNNVAKITKAYRGIPRHTKALDFCGHFCHFALDRFQLCNLLLFCEGLLLAQGFTSGPIVPFPGNPATTSLRNIPPSYPKEIKQLVGFRNLRVFSFIILKNHVKLTSKPWFVQEQLHMHTFLRTTTELHTHVLAKSLVKYRHRSRIQHVG